MKISSRKLYFLLIAVLSGFLITIQLKSNIAFQGAVTIQNIFDMQQEVENLKNENEQIKASTAELMSKYQAYQSEIQDKGSILETMKAESEKMRDFAGLLEVSGPGIVIELNDSDQAPSDQESLQSGLIHDLDILEIVNELKAAGAEAISINDERVISTSSIRCGGPVINIDGKRHATPFVIKAVGDPKKLEATALAPDNYIKDMEYFGIRASVKKLEHIVMKPYDGVRKQKFIKRTEGGETK